MRHYWAAHIHFQSSNIFTWKKEKPYAGKLQKLFVPQGRIKTHDLQILNQML